MSAGQEIGSPIRENRTLLPAPLPPDEARGTLAAAAGVSTVGLRPPFDTPAAAFSSRLPRRSHLDRRAAPAGRLPSGAKSGCYAGNWIHRAQRAYGLALSAVKPFICEPT